MRVYTANELQVIVDKAFELGVQAGRTLAHNAPTKSPRLAEIYAHDFGSSLLASKLTAKKKSEN